MTRTLAVTGMSCGGCEQNVEDALSALDGVADVAADHESNSVELTTESEVAEADIEAAVEEAGYALV